MTGKSEENTDDLGFGIVSIWDLELFQFGIWNFGFGIYFAMKFRRRILIKSSKNFRSLFANARDFGSFIEALPFVVKSSKTSEVFSPMPETSEVSLKRFYLL